MIKADILNRSGRVSAATLKECLEIMEVAEEKYNFECIIVKMKKGKFDNYVIETKQGE